MKDDTLLAERMDMVVFLDKFTKLVLPKLTGFEVMILVLIMEGWEIKDLAYKMGLDKEVIQKDLKRIARICRSLGLHKILFHK